MDIMGKLWCLLGFHLWTEKYSGYYEEKRAPDAVCIRCGRKYSDR